MTITEFKRLSRTVHLCLQHYIDSNRFPLGKALYNYSEIHAILSNYKIAFWNFFEDTHLKYHYEITTHCNKFKGIYRTQRDKTDDYFFYKKIPSLYHYKIVHNISEGYYTCRISLYHCILHFKDKVKKGKKISLKELDNYCKTLLSPDVFYEKEEDKSKNTRPD